MAAELGLRAEEDGSVQCANVDAEHVRLADEPGEACLQLRGACLGQAGRVQIALAQAPVQEYLGDAAITRDDRFEHRAPDVGRRDDGERAGGDSDQHQEDAIDQRQQHRSSRARVRHIWANVGDCGPAGR